MIAIKFTIEIPCSENGAVHPNDIVWEFIFVYYDWTLFTTNTCGYRQYSVFPSSYTLGVLVPVVRKTTGEISVNKLIYYSAAVIIWEMTHFERQRKKGLCSLLFTFLSLRPSYRRFRFRFCHCRFFKSVHFFFLLAPLIDKVSKNPKLRIFFALKSAAFNSISAYMRMSPSVSLGMCIGVLRVTLNGITHESS